MRRRLSLRMPGALGRFLRDSRAGAAGIAAAAVTVMTVGGAALIGDHLWLYDQRDVLKDATSAASIAATLELERQLTNDPTISDEDLKAALKPIAKRYVEINLGHLPEKRRKRAKESLEITEILPNRGQRVVNVKAEADLGGTLFAAQLPLLGNYEGPDKVFAQAGVEAESTSVKVVLAIDTSGSMTLNLDGGDTHSGASGPAAGRDCPSNSNAVECSRMEIVKRAASNLVGILKPGAKTRVEIGIVPWHTQVRLDTATADAWEHKQWARYPTRRRYEVPYLNCNRSDSKTCTNLPDASEEALPAIAEDWMGCLNESRLGTVGSTAALPALDDLFTPPSQNHFAQSYFPEGFGYDYRCKNPDDSDFPPDLKFQICYVAEPDPDATPSQVYWSDTPAANALNRRLFESGVYWLRSPRAPQSYSCPSNTSPILPLRTDAQEITDAIEAISSVGRLTYSALGVLWGQRLLLPSWQGAWGAGADPDAPAGDAVRKVIVLLTDGEDTYCGIGNHECDNERFPSRRIGFSRSEACTAAKAQGTEIFVVAAMLPEQIDKEFGDALRECSSQGDRPDGKYVFLNNKKPADLEAAFRDIAGQLRKLRRIL